MLSKKQAEAASDALLDSGRHERDENSPLISRFPELARLAYSQRKAVLAQARKAVWRRWYVLIPIVGLFMVAVLWVWAIIARMEAAKSMWLFPFLASILMRQWIQRQTRRELQRILADGEAVDSEVR